MNAASPPASTSTNTTARMVSCSSRFRSGSEPLLQVSLGLGPSKEIGHHAHGPAENRSQAMELPLGCDGNATGLSRSESANEPSLKTGATPGETWRCGRPD